LRDGPDGLGEQLRRVRQHVRRRDADLLRRELRALLSLSRVAGGEFSGPIPLIVNQGMLITRSGST